MNGIALGPLVLAADRFAVVLGVMVFIAVSAILARRVDQKFDSWSWWVLAGGIAAARLGHVALYWNSFAQEPWRMIALWDGGFFWPAGAAAILLTISVRSRDDAATGVVARATRSGTGGLEYPLGN